MTRRRLRRWAPLSLALLFIPGPGCRLAGPGDAAANAQVPAIPAPEPLDEALEALASADPGRRLGAVQALGAFVETERRTSSYRSTADVPPAVQAAAAHTRARLVAALPRLQSLLTDASPAVRGEVVYILGGLGVDAASAADGIRRFLHDQTNPATYRQHAPIALARILAVAALPDLEGVIGSPAAHPMEVAAAFHALGELGAPALEATVAHATSPSPTWRRVALDTLARMGPAAASVIPTLMTAARSDASYEVRAAAVRALVKVEPALTASEPVLIEAAMDPKHSRRLCDDVATALDRRPVTNRFDGSVCGRIPGRAAESYGERTKTSAAALARVHPGATRGTLTEVAIGDFTNTRERFLVGCVAPQAATATIDGLLRNTAPLPNPATSRFTLVVARLDADDRVLDHRTGEFDADARIVECHDGQGVWQHEPTRWPVVSFGYRSAYATAQGPVVIDWRAEVISEQMSWRSRFPVGFARTGAGFSDQLAIAPANRDTVLVVGAMSGVVQRLATPPVPLNARFGWSGATALAVPMVVATDTMLGGPFASVSLDARPWPGATTPLPRFVTGGFQAALDPAAVHVSSLAFWRAQLAHPHMAVRLAAIHKLMETGFTADVVQPVADLLTVPSRYADLAGDVALKVGLPLVPALKKLLRSGDAVAVRRAASLLVRPELGSAQAAFDVATDAGLSPGLRETVLEALDLRGGAPSDQQAQQLAAHLSEFCGSPARGCWRALNVLQRTSPQGRAAVLPAVRAWLTAPRPFDRVQAARAVGALGDRDAAWIALAAEVASGSDQALAAMSTLDSARARPAVLAALASENRSLRSEATRILMADTAPGDDLVRAATPLLAAADPQQRLQALQVLQHARTPAVDALVAQALRDPDARVRDAAAPLAIARIETLLPQLRDALRDRTFRRRADVAAAISRLGQAGSVAMPDLLAALDTGDASLRVSLINAIHALGRDRLPVDDLERFAAARGVLPAAERRIVVLQTLMGGGRLDARVLPFLRSMLRGQSPQVQSMVARTLEQVGVAALPTLTSLDVPATSPDLRSQVRAAILKLQPGGVR